MRASMAEQDELLSSVRRAWILPGRTRDEHFIARLGFRPRSLLPVLVVDTMEATPTTLGLTSGVDINRLPLAAVDKYTSLVRSVAEWRRGVGVLPEGDVHPEGLGQQATTTP